MDTAASGLKRAHKLITTESRRTCWLQPSRRSTRCSAWLFLVVGGFLLDLLVSRGVTHLQPDQVESAPFWLDVPAGDGRCQW